jgi:hypothetical protein
MTTQQIPQAVIPPPKTPRRWPKRVGAGVALAAALGIGIGIGEAGHPATKTVAVPGPTKIVTKVVTVPGPARTVIKDVPGPTKIVTQIKDVPVPPPTEGTLLNFTGSGTEVAPSFNVAGSGDYIVSWTFSGNDSQGTGGDNFIVSENTAGSGQDSNALSLPNVIQSSGSGNTEVDGDTGSHTFSVQADPTATWTMKVVSAP